MRYEGNCARDLKIAYIGGGSRDWAWCLMRDLALEPQMEGTVRLYDIDRNAAEQNAVIGNRISDNPKAKAHWVYQAVGSLPEALADADFTVISILPGTFDEMHSDVHAPEKYGVYQSVGDTTGPAGCIRALRTVPMYVTIAEAIRRYAPGTWVINYTNPMAQCVAALYAVYPDIRAFGCCHGVFHTQELLCAMLREDFGVHATRRDLSCVLSGVNHFAWITAASYQGMDLFPGFRDFALRHREAGFDESGRELWKTNPFESANRVTLDLFLRYGAVPAGGDRHICEFLPPWYLRDPETVAAWRFGLTSVAWRKQDLKERLARSAALFDGRESMELKPTGEEGHLMMKALLGLGDMLTNVNLPNRGQAADLPLDVVVETNAWLSAQRVSPVMAGNLPDGVLGLVMPHAVNQRCILRAALSGDREAAFRAFLNEPLARLDPADARALFDEMLGNTAAYVPAMQKT
ncbi:MAG: alpha-glucosidase/alpha-galactosidase [Clostridiales bacterium]|nr:alpha-glucosidase/alpha-galactosidase [Clostridiales bacterium]